MIETVGNDGSRQVNIDVSQAKDIKCDECENDSFKQTILLKRLSALVSPTGQEVLIPMQVFACEKCGHINDEFRKMETQ
tara:strand:+ start:170 stop:406 length:237 start_codon:yes stop_codon:yes gene_type:complete